METAQFGGQRLTSQRRLLIDILSNAQGHLDADELYRQARERDPRISLSTVYRTLRLFKEAGMVDERRLGEGHHHYERKGEREHHHIVCLDCGKVLEFESPLTDRLKEEVSSMSGFEVLSAEIYMDGYCNLCRRG